MSAPLKCFLWLLSDDEDSSRGPRELVARPEGPTHLRLVPDEVTEGPKSVEEETAEGGALLERMQDLFDTDGSSRYEEDTDVWRRMAVAVILAITGGIVAALGAGVAFSGL